MVAAVSLVSLAFLLGPQSAPSVPPSQQTAAPGATAPTYTTRWVEGTLYTVGSTPEHQVSVGWITEYWQSTVGGTDPHLLLIVTNRGNEPITFDPDAIHAWVREKRGDSPLRVYSTAETELEMRNRRSMRDSTGLGSSGTRTHVPSEFPVGTGPHPFGKIAENLLRRQTLGPNTSYEGVVYLGRTRAPALRVEVKVGDDVFVVELPRAKSE